MLPSVSYFLKLIGITLSEICNYAYLSVIFMNKPDWVTDVVFYLILPFLFILLFFLSFISEKNEKYKRLYEQHIDNER